MKFSCDRNDLISAISQASSAVSQKSTIPALEGILITAGTVLSLTGYNLETGICCVIDADIQEMGKAVFSARLFSDIIRKMPGSTVIIEVDETNLKAKIRSDNSRFTINVMSASDFPPLPDVEDAHAISVPQNMLKDMLTKTIFAVSDNKTRPIQCGCKFEIENETMIIVAVDGYRLAYRKETIDNPDERSLSFVVPAASLRELIKILDDSDEEVSFTVGTSHISFQCGHTLLVCRLLEGEFLNWKGVIPKDNSIHLQVSTTELTQTTERMSLIISEKIKSPVILTFDVGTVKVETKNVTGEAEDVLLVEGDGQGLQIGFNARFLLDALHAISDEKVQLELKTPISPAILRPIEGDRYLHMVLPVRLRAV